jgi:hypothetical protein
MRKNLSPTPTTASQFHINFTLFPKSNSKLQVTPDGAYWGPKEEMREVKKWFPARGESI